METIVRSSAQEIIIGPEHPTAIIGERINPTGKKLLAASLAQKDMTRVRNLALSQIEQGATILDVNVGAAGVNEVEVLPLAVKAVMEATDLPLCLDSANAEALRAALSVYQGKALINSVNGEEASLQRVLPLVKEYGAAVIGLCMDDDGIPADGHLIVNGGTIQVAEAYEGLEAANIAISGGAVDLVTADDALNAAGGADQSGGAGRFGNDNFARGGAFDITISGGSVSFFAGGDGIDSNGTLNISGGNITAIINSSADNGALDSDGAMTFTGGVIIYGGTGIGSALSNGSTQSYVLVSSGITAGQEITVRKDSQTLITFTPATDCRYLALSSPDVKSGESYEVYSGGSLLTAVTAGTGGGTAMGNPGGMGAPGGRDGSGRIADPGAMNGPGGLGDPGGRQ